MTAHRYWRLELYTNSGASSAYSAKEIELRPSVGGSDLTGSGTASSFSSYDPDYVASKAFDNDNGTLWSSAGGMERPEYLKYDFGAGNECDIEEVTYKAAPTYSQAPTMMSLSYSDDDKVWHTKYVWCAITGWGDGTVITFNTSSPFYVPKNNGTARRYWRLAFRASGGASASCAEIELMDSSGSDVTGSGTASASAENGSYPASNCFNDNTSDLWTNWPSNQELTGLAWVQYDFGSGNAYEIVEFTWRCRADGYGNQNPRGIIVLCSDDGSNWYWAWTSFDESFYAWPAGEIRKYVNGPRLPSPPSGTHRFWRLRFVHNASSSPYSVAECELRGSTGGADLTGSGSAFAGSTYEESSLYRPALAFDDSGSIWYAWAGALSGEDFLAYDFGHGNECDIKEIALTARDDQYYEGMATDLSIEYSDDAINWTELQSWSGLSWSQAETKILSIDLPGGIGVSSDTLGIIRDAISKSLVRTRIASIWDGIKAPTDLLYPPPIEAKHLNGNLTDALQAIRDSLTRIINHDWARGVLDALRVLRDSVSAAKINIEAPARWVAPISITPRVVTIDPLHLAAHAIRHPSRYFEPRVKSYGTFTRAISAPAGFVKTGDATLTLLDPDNSIRRRIPSKTIRKAVAEIRLGPEGGSLAAFLRPFKRSVGTVSQGTDGELSINLRDLCFDFLERKIPGMINETNFPDLPDSASEDFAPLIIGDVSSVGGAIKCPYVDKVKFQYIASRDPIKAVTGVYRKDPDSDEFALVSPSEYTIVTTKFLDNGEGGGNYCTLIQFGSEQEGEIRANVQGIIDSDGNLRCTNFSDFLLEMFEYLTWLTDRNDALNLASFEQTKDRVADLLCAGAITEPMTFGELVSRIQRSSNIDVFADKNDRVSIHYTTDDEEPTVDLDDVLRLYKGSVRQQLAEPAYNRIPYKYAPNYATGKWTEDKLDNDADQTALGEVAEEEALQMYFVRDAATALTAVERRAQYLDLDSFRFEADIPLIPVLEELELSDLVGITHFGGIKAGGYVGEQFKVLELSMDVQNLKYHVKGIRRRLSPPVRVETPPGITPANGASPSGVAAYPTNVQHVGMASEYLKTNARCGPHWNGIEGELFGVFVDYSNTLILRVWHTSDWGVTWAIADELNQPNIQDTIASFDSCVSGGLIHIATEEWQSGRVAYHSFDMASRQWVTKNETVVGSIANEIATSRCVSVECRNPGGEPLIYFQGERELVNVTFYRRGYYAIKLGGTWTAPVMVTPDPGKYPENSDANVTWWPRNLESSDCNIERVVPGRENRMHLFYQVYPAVCGFMGPDEYGNTLDSNRDLTGRQYYSGTSWVYYPAPRNMGGWVTNADRTRIYKVWKGGLGRPIVSAYAEGSSLQPLHHIYPYAAMIFESFGGGSYPAGFFGYHKDALYFAFAPFLGPDQIGIQTSTDEGLTWGNKIAAGPEINYPIDQTQHLCGNFFEIRGKFYLAYFSGPYFPTFRWLQVDKLPYV